MAALCGGVDNLMKVAEQSDDAQWCLELCDHLIALGAPAEMLKAQTMEKLSKREINATARNSYIWAAEELRKSQGDS